MQGPNDDTLIIGSSQDTSMFVVDPNCGSTLYTFKSGSPSPHGLLSIPQSDAIVACQYNKLAIHMWVWSKDAPVFKCHIAEKLGPIVVTPCGNYLFAGAKSGKIYAWYVPSGELLKVWDAHYKAVSALAFTSDSFYLVSGGEDSVINVWSIVDLLDTTRDTTMYSGMKPFRSWTDHMLPISALLVGVGGLHGRVVSCSLDSTCKLWDIASGERIYSISCPAPISCLAMDILEHRVFLGCNDSKIYTLNLNAAACAESAAAAQIAALNPESDTPWEKEVLSSDAFEGHGKPITALTVSECGKYLISGCQGGAVRVWDSASRQSLRSIDLVSGPVSTLVLISRPKNLRALVEKPLRQVVPLKKYLSQS